MRANDPELMGKLVKLQNEKLRDRLKININYIIGGITNKLDKSIQEQKKEAIPKFNQLISIILVFEGYKIPQEIINAIYNILLKNDQASLPIWEKQIALFRPFSECYSESNQKNDPYKNAVNLLLTIKEFKEEINKILLDEKSNLKHALAFIWENELSRDPELFKELKENTVLQNALALIQVYGISNTKTLALAKELFNNNTIQENSDFQKALALIHIHGCVPCFDETLLKLLATEIVLQKALALIYDHWPSLEEFTREFFRELKSNSTLQNIYALIYDEKLRFNKKLLPLLQKNVNLQQAFKDCVSDFDKIAFYTAIVLICNHNLESNTTLFEKLKEGKEGIVLRNALALIYKEKLEFSAELLEQLQKPENSPMLEELDKMYALDSFDEVKAKDILSRLLSGKKSGLLSSEPTPVSSATLAPTPEAPPISPKDSPKTVADTVVLTPTTPPSVVAAAAVTPTPPTPSSVIVVSAVTPTTPTPFTPPQPRSSKIALFGKTAAGIGLLIIAVILLGVSIAACAHTGGVSLAGLTVAKKAFIAGIGCFLSLAAATGGSRLLPMNNCISNLFHKKEHAAEASSSTSYRFFSGLKINWHCCLFKCDIGAKIKRTAKNAYGQIKARLNRDNKNIAAPASSAPTLAATK